MFRPLAEIHPETALQQLRPERQLQQAPVSPVEQDDTNYQQDLRRANYYLRKVLSSAEKLGIRFDRAQSLERADTHQNVKLL